MLINDTTIAKTIVSGVYTRIQIQHKDQFFEHLAELSTAIDSPWCLIEDFNEIKAPNEKRGS